MYDNRNFNNNDYQQPYTQPQPPQQEVKVVRKKSSTLKVAALVLSVTLLAGGAGFGGAYIASKDMIAASHGSTQEKPSTSADNGTSSKNENSIARPDNESMPTLDELQEGVSVTHKLTTEVEFNSDGSFAYTRDLVAAVRDSVVYIEAYIDPSSLGYGYGYAGDEPIKYSAGSGIILSSDGYIITNNHVVENMVKYEVSVTTTDPIEGTGVVEVYEAKLVGSDADTDLAVLKIEAEGLQAAVLGDSDELHLGDDIVVIGNPMGLKSSVSKGIVSGLQRELSSGDWSLPSIQTDAGINSGNSGGAMFNMYGEVVGVVNAKLINDNAENLGFAITINEAKQVIEDLISRGYVTGRPVLGVTCLEVTEYVAAIRGMTAGLYITEIDQSLAVAESELVVGDTIVAVEGKQVTSVSDVSEILAESDKKPGDEVNVTVVRVDTIGRNKEVKFDIELSEYSGG